MCPRPGFPLRGGVFLLFYASRSSCLQGNDLLACPRCAPRFFFSRRRKRNGGARTRKRCAFAVALIQISDGKKGWILRYPKRREIQKIPIGVYPVYLMSTKNNLGTCCSAIAVK